MSSQTDMSVTTVETETTCYFMPTASLKACSSLLDDHLQRDPRHISLPRSVVPDDLPLDSIFSLMISDGILRPLPLPKIIILARAVIALKCDALSAPVIIRLSHFFFPSLAQHVNNSPAGDKIRAENARDVLKLSFASPLFRCFSRPAIYYLLLRDLTTLSESESLTLTHDESSFVNNNLQDLRAKFVEAEKKVLREACPAGRCARKWKARKWTLSEMHDPIRALLWVSDGCSTCRSKWIAYCTEIWAGMDMWHA